MTPPFEAFFLPIGGGQRFCIHHSPRGAVRAAVLYVHPFAEEMNKSRRMAALQSRQLADAGCAVLQIDLHGCGDSSGDFGDATWESWIDDLVAAAAWLRQRHAVPLLLWGLRAGCLLATEAARRLDAPCHFLFWQPPANGKLLLQQFLRLKMAGQLEAGAAKGVTEALRQALRSGDAPEIAGYTLHPALASGLEAATLQPPQAGAGAKLFWIEITNRQPPTLSPVAEAAPALWQPAGFQFSSLAVAGPAFWQTTEIEEAPALLQATVDAMRNGFPT